MVSPNSRGDRFELHIPGIPGVFEPWLIVFTLQQFPDGFPLWKCPGCERYKRIWEYARLVGGCLTQHPLCLACSPHKPVSMPLSPNPRIIKGNTRYPLRMRCADFKNPDGSPALVLLTFDDKEKGAANNAWCRMSQLQFRRMDGDDNHKVALQPNRARPGREKWLAMPKTHGASTRRRSRPKQPKKAKKAGKA